MCEWIFFKDTHLFTFYKHIHVISSLQFIMKYCILALWQIHHETSCNVGCISQLYLWDMNVNYIIYLSTRPYSIWWPSDLCTYWLLINFHFDFEDMFWCSTEKQWWFYDMIIYDKQLDQHSKLIINWNATIKMWWFAFLWPISHWPNEIHVHNPDMWLQTNVITLKSCNMSFQWVVLSFI